MKKAGCTLYILSSSIKLWGINLWWCVVSSSRISHLDHCFLTVLAEMTDSPSGASASQILVMPKVAFPDVGPADSICLWSKTEEVHVCKYMFSSEARSPTSLKHTYGVYKKEVKAMRIYNTRIICNSFLVKSHNNIWCFTKNQKNLLAPGLLQI